MPWLDRLRSQFVRPTGILGHLAGYIMAYRSSNVQRNDWTVSLLDIQSDDDVLEIGFGPGVALRMVTDRVRKGHVVGVDYSATMLQQARRRNASATKDGRLDLILADVAELPELNRRFNKVFSVNSVMFWDAPITRLMQIRQCMRQGGLIALSVQPRAAGATDADTRQIGEKLAIYLRDSGFADVRVDIKPMKPVSTVCVLGVNADQPQI